MGLILSHWNNRNVAREESFSLVSLTDSPNEITTSENVRAFQFEAKPAPTPHVKASLLVMVNTHVLEGEELVINSQFINMKLIANSTPTSGEFYTQAQRPPTVQPIHRQQIARSIADALDQSLSIRNNYNIHLTSYGFIIEALNYGSIYNISATFTGSALSIASTAGTDMYENESYIDYSSFASVYVGSEIYSSVVDKNKSTYIDDYSIPLHDGASGVFINSVSDYVSPVLPFRANTSNVVFNYMDLGRLSDGTVVDDSEGRSRVLRPYFLVYGDSYRYLKNGQRKRILSGVSPVRWVQLGALDTLKPYDLNKRVLNPISSFSFDWLTSSPEKSVTYDSHEYLQFICRKTSNSNSMWIECELTFYDGTKFTKSSPYINYSDLGGNISIDVSPLALGIKNEEDFRGKKVDSYSVCLKWRTSSNSTATSRAKKYVIDRNCYKSKFNFIFLNEFGAWDSLEFRGSVSRTLERQANEVARSLPFDANRDSAFDYEASINSSLDIRETTTVNSGLLSASVYDWASRIIKSSSIFVWDSEQSKYSSVQITAYDYVNSSESNSIKNISLSFVNSRGTNTISR